MLKIMTESVNSYDCQNDITSSDLNIMETMVLEKQMKFPYSKYQLFYQVKRIVLCPKNIDWKEKTMYKKNIVACFKLWVYKTHSSSQSIQPYDYMDWTNTKNGL